jgi:hypothetical protein
VESVAVFLGKSSMQKKLIKGCCIICGKPVLSKYSKYCRVCSHFINRMKRYRFPHKTRDDIWKYVRQNGYVCYYTKMPLDMSNPKSPWYCVFDHWIPRNDKKVVLTTSLFNDMKSDLSEKEFWYFIDQLANYKKKRIKIKKKHLVYWNRLHP